MIRWTKYGVVLAVLAAAVCTLAASALARTSAAPTLTAFTPMKGPVGEKVTIYGHNLTGAQVQFGAAAVLVKDVTVDPTGTHITVVVPAGVPTGTSTITVTTAGGTVSATPGFTLTKGAMVSSSPHITSFAPMRGKVGSKVTIKGTFFGGTMWVKFGNVKALYTVPSANRIVVTVPKKAHSGQITLQTEVGGATLPARFTVLAA
jgi:IPT/TIG domain